MPLVGIGVVFIGYSLVYYGFTQVRGDNYGFWDLILPGRFEKAAKNPKDSENTSAAISATADAISASAGAAGEGIGAAVGAGAGVPAMKPSGPVAAPQVIPPAAPGTRWV